MFDEFQFIFSFVTGAFGVLSKKLLLGPRKFTLVFSSKTTIALTINFMSVINLEFIFFTWRETGVQFHHFLYEHLIVQQNLISSVDITGEPFGNKLDSLFIPYTKVVLSGSKITDIR